MKLRFISKVQMTSNGRTFVSDTVHDIEDVLAEKLLSAFPTKFERIDSEKPSEPIVKQKARTRKPKAD